MTGETFLSILTGLALSAACGFRVFVPLLMMSIAGYNGPPLSLPPFLGWFQALTGHVVLAPGFEWIGSTLAMKAFGVATLCEIAAYYIPWFDNFLDHITTPVAVVAGILVTASSVTGVSPFLQWTLAIIAGGGIAGVAQGATVVARGGSTAVSLGATNWIVATGEWIGSIVLSVLALVLPALILIIFGFVLVLKSWRGKAA
jgi:hypothetical protein